MSTVTYDTWLSRLFFARFVIKGPIWPTADESADKIGPYQIGKSDFMTDRKPDRGGQDNAHAFLPIQSQNQQKTALPHFPPVVLFQLVEAPPPPEGSPFFHFMAAFVPTGYLTFVKVLELVGGVLVAMPLTRNLGLLLLGPIIVNILACHAFLMDGAELFSPMIVAIVLRAAFRVWVERRTFLGLVRR